MAIKTVNEESLVAIGDAIRAKSGGQEPLGFPAGMVKAIEGIEAKPVIEPIELTGDAQYKCSGPISGAFIKTFGDLISTKDLFSVSQMFKDYTLDHIPFSINIKPQSPYSMTYLFTGCNNLKELPDIPLAYPDSIQSMFQGCYHLREIPDNFGINWNWDRVHTYLYAYSDYVFQNCYSLRRPPRVLVDNLWGAQSFSGPMLGTFCNCYTLDEVKNFPVFPNKLNNNGLTRFVNGCLRLKSLTFVVEEDGRAKTAQWKNQTLDLGIGYGVPVGYANTLTSIIGYNSGITKDKEVKDDATYQALKNDPDWFSCKKEYSRYNHDSAVETINSLPDTSAYGTNTVKFDGNAGSATDGGAINTLTAEEIAVATAKGWTVSFV